MRFLRIYLMVLQQRLELNVSVHRDLDSLIDAWKQAKITNKTCSALVHIGFNRPSTNETVKHLSGFPKRVLMTESARWAFPDEFVVYPRAIGTCKCRFNSEDIPVYVAIKGWGYSIYKKGLEKEIGKKILLEDSPAGWIRILGRDNAELYLVLSDNKIFNEADYIAFRDRLPENLRNEIDEKRFLYLKDSINKKNLWDILKIAPLGLLKTKWSSLNLTVRLENVMRKNSIETLEDLLSYDTYSLLKLENFGKKSLLDLTEIVFYALVERLEERNIAQNYPISSANTKNINESIPNDFKKDCRIIYFVEQELEGLKDRNKEIVLERLGFSGHRFTLEQVGKKYGLTRERVRQIESKIIKRLIKSEAIKNNLIEKLDTILNNRKEPLLLEFLEVEDDWFEGFSGKYDFLAWIIENLTNKNFHVFNIQGRNVISRITQNKWNNIAKTVCELLEDEGLKGCSAGEIDIIFESVLNRNKAPELLEILQNVFKNKIIFAASKEKEFNVFIGYGATVENLILAVLTESDCPLHYTEIANRIKEKYSRSVETLHIANSALTAGFKLFSRGTYGLKKHGHLDEDEKEDIINAVESIMLEGDTTKQWHCHELANLLYEKRPDLSGNLDKYLLNIIFEESDRLISLGRQVWTIKKGKIKSKLSRIDISQALISILEDSGAPLKEKELKNTLSRKRGIITDFQIQPRGRMISVAPGVWGLIDRDIPLSQKQRETFLIVLHKLLHRRKKALHISEIKKSVTNEGFKIPKSIKPYTLFRIAQSDSRFRVGHGRLLGLESWKEFNRLNLRQAVRIIFNESSSLSFNEILKRVEELLERDVEKQSVQSVLQNLDISYNHITGFWESSSNDLDKI